MYELNIFIAWRMESARLPSLVVDFLNLQNYLHHLLRSGTNAQCAAIVLKGTGANEAMKRICYVGKCSAFVHDVDVLAG